MPQNSYPAFMFHKDFAPRKVNSAAEEAALGKGWVDSPEKLGLVPSEKNYTPAFEINPAFKPAKPSDENEDDEKGGNHEGHDHKRLTNKELIALLVDKGHKEEDLEGKKKAELIELFEASEKA